MSKNPTPKMHSNPGSLACRKNERGSLPATKGRGRNSSPTYAMAIEGSPARTTPCSARSPSNVGKLGLAATSRAKKAEQKSDAAMIALRPRESESAAATSIETASVAVVTDKDKLATAGETPNSSEKTGIKGWVQ